MGMIYSVGRNTLSKEALPKGLLRTTAAGTVLKLNQRNEGHAISRRSSCGR